MPVPRLQLRHLEEPVHEGAIRVVGVIKWLELWAAQPGGHAGAAGDVHHLVAVVLQQMETSIRIEVQVVIAAPGEIPLVLEYTLERERPQGAVDVESAVQLVRQFLDRGFVQQFGELGDFFPGIIRTLGAKLVAAVVLLAVARMAQVAAASAARSDLPAHAAARAKVVLEEILVELLDVRIEAPAFAVDHHLDEVALERRDVITGHVRVYDFAHERRVGVAVEQVERLVAEQFLIAMLVVDVKVHRPFQVGRHGTKRGVATILQADVLEQFAIDDQVSGDSNVGAVENFHLLLPLVVLERDKQRAKCALVVKLGAGIPVIARLKPLGF